MRYGFFIATLFASLLTAAGPANADQRPVILELFTSQGCYSCPPADELVGKLSKRKDVLPLAFHIDYWDYIGWKDPFAFSAATDRQRAYSTRLGKRNIYTPQMIIDGERDAVGSRWWEIEDGIKSAAGKANVDAIFVPVKLDLTEDGKLAIEIGKGMPPKPADIWLVSFDDKHVTEVPRGENSGKTLHDYNVVRSIERVGTWTGKAISGTLATDAWPEKSENLVLLVQEGGLGAYYGAARVRVN